MNGVYRAFNLFWNALKNTKKDFGTSILVWFLFSLILSILFYFAEHKAQPEEYSNWWQAIVWTFTRYIGDPGHFAGNGPVTLTGRHIDTFIGILIILIFAVPAGLIANGFRKAMEDDKKEKHLQDCRDKILKSFKRVRNPETGYRVVPRNVSIASLVVKKNMVENDIIETVRKYDELCLRNLADTQTRSEHPQDRLVLELLPLVTKTIDGYDIERKSYGIKINRMSNVTIIAPTADLENSVGHFCYYLSQFGGFNLVSRLFTTDIDDRVSYVAIEGTEDEWEAPLKEYVKDIKELSPTEANWNIFIHATKKAPAAQIHFGCKNKEGVQMITQDTDTLHKLYVALSEKMLKYEVSTDMDNKEFLAIGKKNISVLTGAGSVNNAFLLRLSYRLMTWTDRWTPIIVNMAETLRNSLESIDRQKLFQQDSEEQKKRETLWKKKGYGFGDGD